MRSLSIGLAITLGLAVRALSQPMDPHAHSVKNPPKAGSVASAAVGISFSTMNSIEAAVSDALEYFDAVPIPRLSEKGLAIIGLVKVKAQDIYLKESRSKLAPGEYYHWVGKIDGVWTSGFASRKEGRNVIAEVRFAVMSDMPHHHPQVYAHSPDAARAWKSYAERKMAAPGTPPIPPNPMPQPPQPPREWRCAEIWKQVIAPDGLPACTVVGWIRVPAL